MVRIRNVLPIQFRDSLPPCPACAKVSGQAVTSYPSPQSQWAELEINLCMHCGFGYVPTIPFDLDEYYAKQYGAYQGRNAYSPPQQFFAQLGKSERKPILRARRHVEILSDIGVKAARVLDVGAGPGAFLAQMPAKEKFAIEGDEVSHPYLEHVGVTRLGFADLGQTKFDLIVASHFAEHLTVDGLSMFLDGMSGSLDHGGWALIEVPEWAFVHQREVPDRGGHEPHTLFFSEPALLSFMSRHNFTIRYCSNLGSVYPVNKCGEVDLVKFKKRPNSGTSLVVVAQANKH